MRAGRIRTAIGVSVGVHAALAVGVVAILGSRSEPPRSAATSFETRADVHLEFAPEPDLPREAVAMVEPAAPETPVTPPPVADPPVPVADGPPRVQVIVVPQTLPPELVALLKRPATPTAIQPVVATVPKGPAWAANGSPVHGPLPANQCIVYVLDASGSMGEWNRFDAARGSLIATLKRQPETVRFQVVVYSGTAFTPLRSPPGECRPANAENIARLTDALAALPAPAGRSNHVEGLRAALGFRPDLVVLFTDADDLPLGPFRGLLKQSVRSVTLHTARVTATGVNGPVEVK